MIAKRKSLKQSAALSWNDRMQERRKQLLKLQLMRRENILEEIRDCFDNDDDTMMTSKNEKHHGKLENTITKFVKKQKLLPLMQEEYLIGDSLADDVGDQQLLKSIFITNQMEETEWYMLLRPLGKRVLIVSDKNSTSLIEMRANGDKLHVKKTISQLQHNSSKNQTILDGVLYENGNEKKIFVLDLIAWKGTYFNDYSTEFRFYWLTQKWKEEICENITNEKSQNNFMDIQLASRATLVSYLSSSDEFLPNYTIDGVLLYHKEACYTNGTSPFLLSFKTTQNCPYFSELSETLTLRMIYETDGITAKLVIPHFIINTNVIPTMQQDTIVKVKLTLKNINGEEMADDIQTDLFEVKCIETDNFLNLIKQPNEELEKYCDTYGKLLFYLSLQNRVVI